MDEALLEGSVTLVTGGSSGIGRATATRFAEEEAVVVIADTDEDGGRETVETITSSGGTATFVRTDVTERADVEAVVEVTVERFGGLDVLVNNAGASTGDDVLHRVDLDQWKRMIDLNLTSHFLCARSALPHMIRTGGGSMVHMSSVNALQGIGLTGYSAAKSGIFGLSRVIAANYGRHGIRSNVVCPGTIQSETLEAKREREWDDERWEQWFDQYPLGRFGQPDEVASAVLFLATEMAGFVTGSELVVDGGLSASIDQNLLNSMYGIEELPDP